MSAAPGEPPGEPAPGAPGAATSGDLAASERRGLRLRARFAMIALGARTVFLQLLVLVSNIVLARLLDPADFGAFAIVQFTLAFFAFLGDAGLGGALIQQREQPTERALSTVFFVQTALALALVALVGVLAGHVKVLWPSLPEHGDWLLRVLSVSLLLTTLRVIPSILLERELAFGKLAFAEALHTTAFHASVIVLAALGFGVWALIAGVLVQGVVSLITLFAMRPFVPRLAFDRAALRPLLAFGLPFQLKGAIAFFNAAVTPLYAGMTLGADRLGLVNWGQTTAYFPLKLIDIVGRVSFPLYSRLREDERELVQALERNLRICAIGTLFFVGLVLGIGPALTVVVFGAKWLPGLPALYVFAGAISIGFVSPIIGAAFDAIGKPGIFVRLSIVWTLVNWAAVVLVKPLFAESHKVLGFSLAFASHVVVGNLAVIFVLKRRFPLARLLARVAGSLLGGTAVAAVGRFLLLPAIHGPLSFVVAVLASLAVFALVLALADRAALREMLGLFRRKTAAAPQSTTSGTSRS